MSRETRQFERRLGSIALRNNIGLAATGMVLVGGMFHDRVHVKSATLAMAREQESMPKLRRLKSFMSRSTKDKKRRNTTI
jgi:hypothetical protein